MRGDLERAYQARRRREWADAFELLNAADQAQPLAPQDLELLASAAYLVGREEDALVALERAHHAYAGGGERPGAARCAFWSGLFLMLRGELGHASGWLGRAQRLVEQEPDGCVEGGYLLVPGAEQALAAGDCDGALVAATTAADIAERFGDRDLVACARHLQGRALVGRGELDRGLALLDEAMLAACSGDLSPVLTGLIYCSVIDCCLQVYAFSRAREWTAALARWCSGQPQMIAFTATCVVHRAQIMQLSGSWQNAIAEVRGVCERFACRAGQRPPGAAFYQQGEVHRLRGEFDAAEDAYREASQTACDPQPGLALLRLAQGRTEAALAAMRRVMSAASDRMARSRLLPALVEVLLAAGDRPAALEASAELDAISQAFPSDALRAFGAQARAAVAMLGGDAAAALGAATEAWQFWDRLEIPYHGARARETLGLACAALGDHDGERLHLDRARAVFDELGATPDAARVARLTGEPAAPAGTNPVAGASIRLTARELEILRHIAAGRTNRAIARELHLSEKTIERHVSNLFVKLDVPTRAAATAWAYQHKLV